MKTVFFRSLRPQTLAPMALLIATIWSLAGNASAEYSKGQMKHAAAPDIVEVAVSAGQFNTLAAALQAAGLVDTLKGDGPFTVFAPTDEAFSKLPEGTVENLLKPENKEKLVGILTYHVIPGKVFAAEVTKLDSATTVNGEKVRIQVSDEGVRLNQAAVIKTNVMASNGIIHVIDEVVLPPAG